MNGEWRSLIADLLVTAACGFAAVLFCCFVAVAAAGIGLMIWSFFS